MEFIPEIMVIKGLPAKPARKKMVFNYLATQNCVSCPIIIDP